MILYAPAKINLHLSVFDKRPDGYHNIETVFERINILDKIIISSLPTNETKILSDHPELPLDRSGLIHRTVDALRDRTGVKRGVEINILKNIPIAAGLGGGSSNAASVLIGLNKMWKLKLKKDELSDIGKRLGADIPFFLEESSFALAKNIGDVITPLSWKIKLWHLIVSFPVKLFSKDIYEAYSNTPSSDKRERYSKLSVNGKRKVNFDFIKSILKNDLEKSVLSSSPIVGEIKNALKDVYEKSFLVSGSGPSVFGLFEDRKEALRAEKLLRTRLSFIKQKGWRTFVVSTL